MHRPGRTRPPIRLVTEHHPRTHRVGTLRRDAARPRTTARTVRTARPGRSSGSLRPLGARADDRRSGGSAGPAPSRPRPRRGRARRRRSRSCTRRRRDGSSLRDAEGEEGARALVQMDVHADPFVAARASAIGVERDPGEMHASSSRYARARPTNHLAHRERDVALAHVRASAIHSPSASIAPKTTCSRAVATSTGIRSRP